MRRAAGAIAWLVLAFGVTGCEQKAATVPASSARVIAPIPEPEPAPTATRITLDYAALDQPDPDRVLRFYASAIATGDWLGAARIWGDGSGVDGPALERRYGRMASPTLLFGTGEIEGGAGSLYYEVSATLTDASGAVIGKGKVTLRRVNNVPGATPSQLRWHFGSGTQPL